MPEYRYERKFWTTRFSLNELLKIIRTNPAQFREIFGERAVNNIYFDDIALSNYFANDDGSTLRIKTRVRWYGDLIGDIPKPTLELKIKYGWAGEKPSYRLAPFSMDGGYCRAVARNCFSQSVLPEEVQLRVAQEVPVMINRYFRRYFLSADGQCRLTIDRDLSFCRCPHPGAFVPKKASPNALYIIELKYSCERLSAVEQLASELGIRMNKFSKYAVGMRTLYGC